MLCNHCNTEQPDGSVRCMSCGFSLVNQAPGDGPAAVRRKNAMPQVGVIAAVIAAVVCWFTLQGSSSGQAKTPEEAVMLPVHALLANDLNALFATLPEKDIDEMKSKWNAACGGSDPQGDAQYNMAMAQLLAPGAVETLMAMIEPQLEQVDPDVMYEQIEAGMMQIPNADADEAVKDAVLTWIANAGFTDTGKARLAMGHIVEAARAFDVPTTADLRKLSFDDLMIRAGYTLPHLKNILTVYGFDLDQLLRSVSVSSFNGDGPKRTGTISLSLFGKQQSVPTTVYELDGHWFTEDKK
jgi:hypothetical protein